MVAIGRGPQVHCLVVAIERAGPAVVARYNQSSIAQLNPLPTTERLAAPSSRVSSDGGRCHVVSKDQCLFPGQVYIAANVQGVQAACSKPPVDMDLILLFSIRSLY